MPLRAQTSSEEKLLTSGQAARVRVGLVLTGSTALVSPVCTLAGQRPRKLLRLARLRFDSLSPEATPAISWHAEAPLYNRCCTATVSHLCEKHP